MNLLPKTFLEMAALYKKHGFSLYLIGGTSRDILLGIDPADLDFVTDATPEEEKSFLEKADYTFARYGSVKVTWGNARVDVTTLREESGYSDHRHPAEIKFIKDLRLDSMRRDFTINAIYMDSEGACMDFHNGLEDLHNKLIRFIGDPYVRIMEDPLRIIRAERFASRLGFRYEKRTEEAMNDLVGELSKLNPEKVLMERKKV